MARNHKFYFDKERVPRARGPVAEAILMSFLEADVQGSDHICHDLMDDMVAIEDGSDDEREFIGNAHSVTINAAGVVIERLESASTPEVNTVSATDPLEFEASVAVASETAIPADAHGRASTTRYHTALKHFREVLEDWEAFILDDDFDDESLDDDFD